MPSKFLTARKRNSVSITLYLVFVEKSIKAFLEKNPTKEIKEVFDQEIEKYEQMDENSMEAGIIKTYIE